MEKELTLLQSMFERSWSEAAALEENVNICICSRLCAVNTPLKAAVLSAHQAQGNILLELGTT